MNAAAGTENYPGFEKMANVPKLSAIDVYDEEIHGKDCLKTFKTCGEHLSRLMRNEKILLLFKLISLLKCWPQGAKMCLTLEYVLHKKISTTKEIMYQYGSPENAISTYYDSMMKFGQCLEYYSKELNTDPNVV